MGGTHQEDDWSTQPNESDKKFIWNGCHKLVPDVKGAKHLKDWVGLRPSRTSVRIERETLPDNIGLGNNVEVC